MTATMTSLEGWISLPPALVGTNGLTWDEAEVRLYATREEAQAAADRRNESLLSDADSEGRTVDVDYADVVWKVTITQD